MYRRDQNNHGGGILVNIKNCYHTIDLNSHDKHEIISMKIKINGSYFNYIFSYKPPSTKLEEYIDALDEHVNKLNLNMKLFIIGHLNYGNVKS